MNSDKSLETAAIFFFLENIYLKQDIGFVNVMGYFISLGLINL